MPIYQYECRSCQHQLEISQSMNDEALIQCPVCNKNDLFRLVTGGLGFFMNNRTVGAIADNNTNRMSEDLKTHLNNKNKTKTKDTLSSKIKNEVKPKTKVKTPWYKENQKIPDKKLQNSSQSELQRYIETGNI